MDRNISKFAFTGSLYNTDGSLTHLEKIKSKVPRMYTEIWKKSKSDVRYLESFQKFASLAGPTCQQFKKLRFAERDT